jgi:phenylacetate-coenzyme A ligase PaaK-like adenylate-forming protein
MLPHETYLLAKLWLDQWKSPQALERVREKKLRRLISHAYHNVPFYRAIFEDRRIRPEDIRTAADLSALPLISKKDLLDRPVAEKLAAGCHPRNCRTFLTSGTTGRPLSVYYTRRDWTMINLGSARAFFAMGMRPWHRISSFVGKAVTRKSRKWYEYMGVWRGRDLSSWEHPRLWIDPLRRWQPHVLIGYVMTLKILAETLRAAGHLPWAPDLIISGSGVLDDFTRRFLASVFSCPVRDYYASFEAGTMAWECKTCGSYHLSSDTVIVEILADGKPVSPGETGEVVITNLHAYAMPFIRYRQEDEAVLSTRRPKCGRGLPLLDRIQGRADDCVILGDGRKIPSQPFYYSIEPVPGVNRWKVFQEDLLTIRIDIEPGAEFNEDSRRLIERNLRKVIGNGMTVKFSIVPSIPVHPSQKFRQVVSWIARPDQFPPPRS